MTPCLLLHGRPNHFVWLMTVPERYEPEQLDSRDHLRP